MTKATEPPAVTHLPMVQSARAIAALFVVLHHVVQPRENVPDTLAHSNFGAAGVMVFFVISGFIMVQSCRNDPPLTFLWRRVIRIVPLYWVLTIVYFAFLNRAELMALTVPVRTPELIKSLLFIPHYHGRATDQVWPVLVQGWTLNYEMLFFLIFAIGLASGRVFSVTAVLLLGLVAVGLVLDRHGPVVSTWTDPLLLLFLAGMLISRLFLQTSLARFAWCLPVGLGGLVGSALVGGQQGWTVVAMAASGIAVILGIAAHEQGGKPLRSKWLERLGDASYSIYLSHTFLLIVLLDPRLLPKLTTPGQLLLLVVVAMIACIAAGLVVHRVLERPMIAALRRRTVPDRRSLRPESP